MGKIEGWPVVKSDNITIGNPEAEVAFATLWTKRGEFTSGFDPHDFAVAGQLYSREEGISLMLRNLFGNPNIRRLVICGSDLSGSGEALACLWRNGIDNNHHILGIEKAPVPTDIPKEAIEMLRQKVEAHDLRSLFAGGRPTMAFDVMAKGLMSADCLGPWGEPIFYPVPEVTLAKKLPSEAGAHLVSGRTIGETWMRITREVMSFGEDDETNYGNEARDLSNLVAVVTDEDPDNPDIAEYFDFTRAEVDSYVQEFLSPECPPGVFYTYGQRIHAYGAGKINQAEIMVRKLRADPNDRGAVAILYDPIHDNQLDVEVPMKTGFRNPCIVFIQAAIKSGKLELAAFFRSNDMFRAWPENAFGLRAFQGKMAKELERPLGPLTTVSMRAHIYEEPWKRAQAVLEQYSSIMHGFKEDPRGNFTIGVDPEGQIIMTHRDHNGKALRPDIVWNGRRDRAAEGLWHQIARQNLISSSTHGLYLGEEIAMATLAAKLGLPYRQNDPDSMMEALAEMSRKAEEYDRLRGQGQI